MAASLLTDDPGEGSARRPIWLALRRPTTGTLVALAAGLVVAYLVLPPIFILVWSSLKTTLPGAPGALTLSNFERIFSQPAILTAFINTFIYAAGSTVLGLVLAFALAWLVERTNVPGGNLTYALVLASMALPGILVTIAWTFLLDPNIGLLNKLSEMLVGTPMGSVYSMGGMIFVGALRDVPIIFLVLTIALKQTDPSLEEAAAMSGAGPWFALRHVSLPLALPAIGAAFLYAFINAIESFEIPGILGLRGGLYVLSTYLYLALGSGIPDYGLAAALGLIMMVVTILGLLGYHWLVREADRFATVTGKGFRPNRIDLGRWKSAGTVFICLITAILVVLPVLVLVYASLQPYYQVPSMKAFRSMSLDNYASLLRYPGIADALKNTLIVGGTAGVIGTLLPAVVSWVVLRTDAPGRRLLDLLAFLPLAVPSIVLGVALVLVYLNFATFLYGTLGILIVAYITKYMPWAVRNTNVGVMRIHRELEEAAHLSGATWWFTLRRIYFPLLYPALLGVFIYIFLHAVREVSVSIFLYTSQSRILSVMIWEMWSNGDLSELSALGIAMITAVLVLVFMSRKWLERAGLGREGASV